MNRAEREAAVRRIMERTPPPVPAELHPEVVRRGGRLVRRRRTARRLGWLLLSAAIVAFVIWATVVQPWVEPPSQTTPPLTNW
ncbi:hypothetical protein GCM10010269_42650 [Streptomyces humidus]|uniref:DUF3040 domain-containing protein n=1 Tax=Streptomyces humidus TaxID=52259 RepID=A0A918FYD3_9ACTN|nr:hypothetical protein [Streptomyces humidus]GGR99253.1 hypothetical protein GCM10010269_42650 [Streptomyces humidus]